MVARILIILFIFLAWTSSSRAQSAYVDLHGGLAHYTSSRFQTDVISVGIDWGGSIGFKYLFMSLEAIIEKSSNQGIVNHQHEDLRLHVKSFHYGLLSRFYWQNKLNLALGYAWHSTDQYLERVSTGEKVFEADGPTIYDAPGERSTSGFVFGVGFNSALIPNWEWFFDALFFQMYEGSSTLKSFNLGVRFLF